jgi:hypothetical protein
MSKMSQMSKLKNHLKSERSNIFKNGQMRKVAQFAQKFLKNRIFFYYPRFLQCMKKIWVNIFKHMGFGVEFDFINTLNNNNNHRKSIYEVKFHSRTHMFENIYPDYLHAL